MITFEDFKKLEIRIGKVLSAEKIEGSDKLLKLEIDLGKEKRQIVVGMAEFFEPNCFLNKELPNFGKFRAEEVQRNRKSRNGFGGGCK